MADRLAGKVAVVTGAGNGIGAGCAAHFRAQGATVIGVDISGADRDCDLTDEGAVADLFAAIGADVARRKFLESATRVFRALNTF